MRLTAARSRTLIWTAATVWTAVYASAAVARYLTLNAHAFDLGIFAQLLWRVGRCFCVDSTIIGHNFAGDHFMPLGLVFAPIATLPHGTARLLVAQAVILASGVFPLHALAMYVTRSPKVAAAIGLAYLAYPALGGAMMWEFHPELLAMPVLMYAVLAAVQGAPVRSALLALVAGLAKEDVWIVTGAWGLVLATAYGARRAGALVIATSIAALALSVLVVIPFAKGAPYQYVERFQASPPQPGAVAAPAPASGIFRRAASPRRAFYVFILLAPVLFLPLLAPLHALPAFVLMTLHMGTSYRPSFDFHYHYWVPAGPFLFGAASVGAARLLARGVREPRLALALAAAAAVSLLAAPSPFRFIAAFGDRHAAMVREAIAREIPPAASVSAQDAIVPLLARRAEIYVVPDVHGARYVVLDRRSPFLGSLTLAKWDALAAALRTEYDTRVDRDGLLILARRSP